MSLIGTRAIQNGPSMGKLTQSLGSIGSQIPLYVTFVCEDSICINIMITAMISEFEKSGREVYRDVWILYGQTLEGKKYEVYYNVKDYGGTIELLK
jgi:hypothetical protein